MSSNKLQMENNIQNPLALAFDKLGHFYVSTKHGEVFKVKVKYDLVSLQREVIAQISLDCGNLYGCDQLYTASSGDEGGVFAVDLGDKKFEKVVEMARAATQEYTATQNTMGKLLSLMLATIHSIYRSLQPVNAAHFLEMAKAQGMVRVANFFSLPVFLLKEKQSLLWTPQQDA